MSATGPCCSERVQPARNPRAKSAKIPNERKTRKISERVYARECAQTRSQLIEARDANHVQREARVRAKRVMCAMTRVFPQRGKSARKHARPEARNQTRARARRVRGERVRVRANDERKSAQGDDAQNHADEKMKRERKLSSEMRVARNERNTATSAPTVI